MLLKSFVLIFFLITSSFSETIYVKYRGVVDIDNGHFIKQQLKNSSLVKEMYYDRANEYLLVRLNHTFYHYCSLPSSIVDTWVNSPSLGRFYNTYIRGNYDCRIYPMPQY